MIQVLPFILTEWLEFDGVSTYFLYPDYAFRITSVSSHFWFLVLICTSFISRCLVNSFIRKNVLVCSDHMCTFQNTLINTSHLIGLSLLSSNLFTYIYPFIFNNVSSFSQLMKIRNVYVCSEENQLTHNGTVLDYHNSNSMFCDWFQIEIAENSFTCLYTGKLAKSEQRCGNNT